jgi:glycosyltransferase involved in cell wall biosynthesis
MTENLPNSDKGVSVVVSSYNQLAPLKLFLEAIQRQTVKPIDVVVADDGSTDGTIEWLNSVKFSFPLSYLTREHGGYRLASLQNLGAKKANGHRLLFTNADVIHCPTSVQGHSMLADNIIGAGIVRSIAEEGVAKVNAGDVVNFSRLVALSAQHPSSKTNCIGPYDDARPRYVEAWGGNFSLAAAVFHQLGGFDEGFDGGWGGEEGHLVKRCQEQANCSVMGVGLSTGYHLCHALKEYHQQQLGTIRYRKLAGT